MTTTAQRPSTTAAVPAAEQPQDLQAQVPAVDLLRELRFVSHAIDSRRPAVPVLAGVLLEGERGGLRLSGYDHVTAATSTVTAPGAQGRAVLGARHLARMLSAIGKADVTLTTAAGRAHLSGAGVVYDLPTFDVADYPARPAGAEHLLAVLDADARERLRRVLVAASLDGTFPELTSVRLEVQDGALAGSATDRYRLAVADRLAPSMAPGDQSWLVPARGLGHALRAFAKDGDVQVRSSTVTSPASSKNPMTLSQSWLHLDAGARSLSTQQVDGTYPKVRALFPPELTWSLTFDRAELVTAIRQVQVAVDGNPLAVEAQADGTVRLVVGESVDGGGFVGSGATKAIPTLEATGSPVGRIAFNPAFLLDGVTHAAGKRITVAGTLPTKPAVLTGDGDEHSRYLLMPIRMAG